MSQSISVKSVATNLGISEKWVNDLSNRGYFEKTSRGKLDLWSVVNGWARYREELKNSELASRISGSADEEVKIERARKLKLENDEREAKLIDTDLGIAAVDLIVGMLRTDLAGVPARITEDVGLRRRAEEAIDGVLAGLAARFGKAARALRDGRDPTELDDAFS